MRVMLNLEHNYMHWYWWKIAINESTQKTDPVHCAADFQNSCASNLVIVDFKMWTDISFSLFTKVTFKRQVQYNLPFFHWLHCQLLVHMTNKPSRFFFLQHLAAFYMGALDWRVCRAIPTWELNIFNESVWWQNGWAVKLALLTTSLGEVDPWGN